MDNRGNLSYTTNDAMGMPNSGGLRELKTPEDWTNMTQPAEPERVFPQPEAIGENVPQPHIDTTVNLARFMNPTADTAARATAMQELITKVGKPSGADRAFTMKAWNVQVYDNGSGNLSYAMKGPDGSIISPRIPLQSEGDWRTMTQHMDTSGEYLHPKPEGTGLFVKEAASAARAKTDIVPSPREVAMGAAKGIRTADDFLERQHDKAMEWAFGKQVPYTPEEIAAYKRMGMSDEEIRLAQERFAIPDKETLPDYDPDATHAERVAERQAWRAEKTAARLAEKAAAVEAVDPQKEAWESPDNLNPAARAAAFAELQTGKLTLPDGTEAYFKPGHPFAIENGATREEAIAKLFKGSEYREIIQRTEGTGRIGAMEQVKFVEAHAQTLASYLEVRDYMVDNGLQGTGQFKELQGLIDQEKAAVGKFGHVIADDPNYGKPSQAQIRAGFIKTESNVRK
jgi:hypothetical protein